jgi:hypothetical protein
MRAHFAMTIVARFELGVRLQNQHSICCNFVKMQSFGKLQAIFKSLDI